MNSTARTIPNVPHGVIAKEGTPTFDRLAEQYGITPRPRVRAWQVAKVLGIRSSDLTAHSLVESPASLLDPQVADKIASEWHGRPARVTVVLGEAHLVLTDTLNNAGRYCTLAGDRKPHSWLVLRAEHWVRSVDGPTRYRLVSIRNGSVRVARLWDMKF